ncbi:MAG: class I SAM-dependent rRNA methyltransferase [Polyangiaceae bacterium]|jgi:23S rRNA (cytosine1962-C5)-methyltransferase|nr:class I SAM-dependent rRNA methyltransferase [Polyangiaceae bacterium]
MSGLSSLPVVTLKSGHIQPIWAGHPWVYAQAIASVRGGARPGDEVAVLDPEGKFLGRGFYTPRSAIPVRLLTRSQEERIDGAFFRRRLQRALALRHTLHLPSGETNAFRLVHAEGDELPGLILDRFGDVLVVQFTSLGMKLREGLLIEAIEATLPFGALVDRTSAEAARLEGFEATGGVLRGPEGVPGLRFSERGFHYELPPELAQKTGFYLDQRPLRARVEQLARGRRVLDAFCFVGSFAMAAARGGATEVLAVDESAVAVDVGASVARANHLGERIQFVREDAKNALQKASREGGYDLVLCDPPKLAPTRASREDALVAYRKLAGLGCRATKPGGILVLSSCSAAVSSEALVRALALGAASANRTAVVLERGFQGADHPVPAAFPEGLYLKSVLARIDER